jgi:diacylglycerol kinase (ATP)
MRLALISNPLSRRHRRDSRLADDLAAQVEGLGQAFAPPNLADLDHVAQALRDADVEVVAISGGDGTMHAVLSALYRAYGGSPLPVMHLLRSGTMNTTARNLEMWGQPRARMADLVERMRWGQALPTVASTVLVVDGHHVGVFFGLGIICGFMEVYYTGAEPTPWKALRVLVQMGLSAVIRGSLVRRVFQVSELSVTVDGTPWSEHRFSAIAAGTVAELGLGFRPFARAPDHPDRMQLLGFVGAPWTIAVSLPRIRRARPIERHDVRDVLSQTVRFEADAPIPYMVDGDLYTGGTTLELAVGPQVRFVADQRR